MLTRPPEERMPWLVRVLVLIWFLTIALPAAR